MTEQEKYWIEMCKTRPDEYVIIVDNDCAFVEDIEKMECAFEFTHWGWRLALDLFQYIGCNVEEA
jgi:hypothetical protein